MLGYVGFCWLVVMVWFLLSNFGSCCRFGVVEYVLIWVLKDVFSSCVRLGGGWK